MVSVHEYVAVIPASVAALAGVVGIIGSTFEITKTGRLRNQIAKETAIYAVLKDSDDDDDEVIVGTMGWVLKRRVALLNFRTVQRNRFWLERHFPLLYLLSSIGVVAALACFRWAGYAYQVPHSQHIVYGFQSAEKRHVFEAVASVVIALIVTSTVMYSIANHLRQLTFSSSTYLGFPARTGRAKERLRACVEANAVRRLLLNSARGYAPEWGMDDFNVDE